MEIKLAIPRSIVAVLATCAMSVNESTAASLTFDGTAFDDTGGSLAIPQAYGDRITSTTMGSFVYGAIGGFTPNIEVSYLSSEMNELEYAGPFFGNLEGVAFNPSDSADWFAIQFRADPGFMVSLSDFDIAKFGGPDILTSVQVLDSGGSELYRLDSFAFTTGSSQFNNHAAIEFSPPLQSSELTIRLETTRASHQWGIDNITFSQIPGPPDPLEIDVTSAEVSGDRFVIQFESDPEIGAWTIQASSDLASFSSDVTSSTVITEISPGAYEAVIDLSAIPGDLRFFRIAG